MKSLETNERKERKKEEKNAYRTDKRSGQQPRQKRPFKKKRDGAVAIKLPTGRTYNDFLGVIRVQVQPEELGAKIRGVGKTRTGDVLV